MVDALRPISEQGPPYGPYFHGLQAIEPAILALA